jgi:hypothetical protein
MRDGRVSLGLAGERGIIRLSGQAKKPPFVNFPRRAFGKMRLAEGDAFEWPEELLRREEMEGLAGVVAGHDACGFPGDLDDIGVGHGWFRGARFSGVVPFAEANVSAQGKNILSIKIVN